MVLKKSNNKFEIDTDKTKLILTEIQDTAKKIAKLQEENLKQYRKEDTLYTVIQKTFNTAYLQDTDTNVVFEEVNFPDNVFNSLCNDAVVRYKNGKYVFEEDLTRKNMYLIN